MRARLALPLRCRAGYSAWSSTARCSLMVLLMATMRCAISAALRSTPAWVNCRSRSMLRRMSRCWCLNLSMFTEGLLG